MKENKSPCHMCRTRSRQQLRKISPHIQNQDNGVKFLKKLGLRAAFVVPITFLARSLADQFPHISLLKAKCQYREQGDASAGTRFN